MSEWERYEMQQTIELPMYANNWRGLFNHARDVLLRRPGKSTVLTFSCYVKGVIDMPAVQFAQVEYHTGEKR